MKYFINPSHLYYTISHPFFHNLKFYSKLDVLDQAKSVDASVNFNWFSDTWNQFDYTKVSDKTYEQLKLERALKLREKYKYLKIYFSGGSDSTTLLNTFVKNNIHIDEIVNWRRSIGSYQSIDPDIENNLSAIPYLKSIQHLIPKTKITEHNLSLKDLETYNVGLNSKYENRRIIFGEPAEMDFVPDHKYLYLQDDRDGVGHIEGGQKPNLFYVNGKWYLGMYDLACTGFYNNAEDFFFDPENPELFVKTAHMLKNYMANLLENDFERFLSFINQRNKKENRKEIMPVVGRDLATNDVSLVKFHFNQHCAPILTYNGQRIKYPYVRTFEIIKSVIDQDFVIDNLKSWSDNLIQLKSQYYNDIKQDRHGEAQPVIGFKPILSTLYNIDDRADVIYTPEDCDIKYQIIVL